MDQQGRDAVQKAYQTALLSGEYPLECYAASNADEYWAEGTQVGCEGG